NLLRRVRQAAAQYDSGLSAAAIREIVERGEAVLLLDGLDEVRPDRREVIYDQLRADLAAMALERCNVVVAGRPWSLDRLGLTWNGGLRRLTPLEPAAVEGWIRAWFAKRKVPERGDRLIGHLASATHIQQLVRRPLMMRLLCQRNLRGHIKLPTGEG